LSLDGGLAHNIQARAEELARDQDHQEGYDLALARAVAGPAVTDEHILPFYKIGGWMIAQKERMA
jgi:16S rRNA (guanine527-N7)-methyltransferase